MAILKCSIHQTNMYVLVQAVNERQNLVIITVMMTSDNSVLALADSEVNKKQPRTVNILSITL